ncbi:MAG: ACT domain-containing protein [Magnetococcales bacterium]|nr:ACT domain-containing protein [Magnetococcales bacterium]MBF0584072.1 ACT domain-containing protein [Magnetococcales bacterium]
MNQHALLTVTGRDRPGIVARTTQVLFEMGCNIADSSMTRLGGAFTVMLIVHLPPTVRLEQMAEAFAALADEMALAIHVQPLSADSLTASTVDLPQGATISVLGADQPGIVFRVTRLLAEMACNIVDLYTRVLGTADKPVYSMVIEVEMPNQSDLPQQLQQRLTQLEKQLTIEIHLRLSDSALM